MIREKQNEQNRYKMVTERANLLKIREENTPDRFIIMGGTQKFNVQNGGSVKNRPTCRND
jgi:hypothetical protein